MREISHENSISQEGFVIHESNLIFVCLKEAVLGGKKKKKRKKHTHKKTQHYQYTSGSGIRSCLSFLWNTWHDSQNNNENFGALDIQFQPRKQPHLVGKTMLASHESHWIFQKKAFSWSYVSAVTGNGELIYKIEFKFSARTKNQ